MWLVTREIFIQSYELLPELYHAKKCTSVLKCVTFSNYFRRTFWVVQLKSKCFESSYYDLLLVKFSSKVMHYWPSCIILKCGGASLKKVLKNAKAKFLGARRFGTHSWGECPCVPFVWLTSPQVTLFGWRKKTWVLCTVWGSYFRKGTKRYRPVGRGDEKWSNLWVAATSKSEIIKNNK